MFRLKEITFVQPILFDSWQNGPGEIYVIDPNGANQSARRTLLERRKASGWS